MWIQPSSFLPLPFKYLESAHFPVISNSHKDTDRAVCGSMAALLQHLLIWKGSIGSCQKFSLPRGFSVIFMTHQSYTCDAVPLHIISQLRFVAPKGALKAQMKGIGLNLILLCNLLCIIFFFFFFSFLHRSRMCFWHIMYKQMLLCVEPYQLVKAKDCDSISDWIIVWISSWPFCIDLLRGLRQVADIFLCLSVLSFITLVCG